MSKAEEITKKILKASDDCIHKRVYEDDCGRTGDVQPAFIEGAEWGYKQAEQDTIEKACQLLYDWNNQMTMIFGAKAVLSCSQFTIDVDRFRKNLKLE